MMKNGFTPLEKKIRNSPGNRRGCSLTGFTLVETVVVTGISVIALVALVNLFFIFNSLYGYQQAFLATAGSSGRALVALEAAILPASKVLASHDFSGTTYTSTTTVLVLELPAVDSSGELIFGTKDYIAFYASSTMLYRLTLAGEGSARESGLIQLSSTLYSLLFTYDASNFASVTNVTADIQTRLQFKEQVVQSHLNEKMYLRNRTPL